MNNSKFTKDYIKRAFLGEPAEDEMKEALQEIVRLNQLITELVQAADIDKKRLVDAAKLAGITYFGCDTPDVMADRILYLESLLRWRPVSEGLPTEDGVYEMKFLGGAILSWRISGTNGLDDFAAHGIIEWRPIPELEVKHG